jgi:RimJ/RimL family protein N-acetyltransferase
METSMSTNIFTGKLIRLTSEDPETDAKAFARWNLDSEYYRLLDSDPPRLWSEKKIKEWMEKDLEKNEPYDAFFRIRTLEDDRLIGFIGFFAQSWNHGDAWVAIAIGERDYWGKGYGTDAMKTLLRYAFHEMNLRRVTLIAFEYNARAIRSYEKAGFRLEGRMRGMMLREGRRWDWLFMGILREEWEQLTEE